MFKAALILTLLCTSLSSFARTRVKVGAYSFVPYYELVRTQHQGLSAQVVDLLNSLQQEYFFEMTYLPANQRYQALQRKRVALFLFEDPAWEWSKYTYDFIPLDVQDGEIYVTRAQVPSPRTFEDLKKLRIAVVKGFHYGFAGLNADEKHLRKNFKIDIVNDSETCITMVVLGRSDVIVVAKSFMHDYLKKNPHLRDKIRLSENYDSIYRLGVVFDPEGAIPRAKMESLIETLKNHRRFKEIIAQRFSD